MHRVSVVPENAEIVRRRAHPRESADSVVGINGTRGIAVFRHAPYTLYRAVRRDESLYYVHVDVPVVLKRHGYHIDAEIFTYRKMTVVARNETNKLDFARLVPRQSSSEPELHALLNEIIHYIKTGIIADQYFSDVHFEKLRKQSSQFDDAVDTAVVSGVEALFRDKIAVGKHRKHIGRNVELLFRRFPPRHIEREFFRLKSAVIFQFFRIDFFGLFFCYSEIFHTAPP